MVEEWITVEDRGTDICQKSTPDRRRCFVRDGAGPAESGGEMERSSASAKDRRLGRGNSSGHFQELPGSKFGPCGRVERAVEAETGAWKLDRKYSKMNTLTLAFVLQEKSAEYQHMIKEFQDRADGVTTYFESGESRTDCFRS